MNCWATNPGLNNNICLKASLKPFPRNSRLFWDASKYHFPGGANFPQMFHQTLVTACRIDKYRLFAFNYKCPGAAAWWKARGEIHFQVFSRTPLLGADGHWQVNFDRCVYARLTGDHLPHTFSVLPHTNHPTPPPPPRNCGSYGRDRKKRNRRSSDFGRFAFYKQSGRGLAAILKKGRWGVYSTSCLLGPLPPARSRHY